VGAAAVAPPPRQKFPENSVQQFPWEHVPLTTDPLWSWGSLHNQYHKTLAGGLDWGQPPLWPPALTNLKSSYRQNLLLFSHLI
jgi:hypothetical protein